MISPAPDIQRIASIHRDASGEVAGVAIWINAAELEVIGINLTDTNGIEIEVTQNGIQLSGIRNDT